MLVRVSLDLANNLKQDTDVGNRERAKKNAVTEGAEMQRASRRGVHDLVADGRLKVDPRHHGTCARDASIVSETTGRRSGRRGLRGG